MKSLIASPGTEETQAENACERWATDLGMPGFLRRQLPRGSHHAAAQTQELSYSWPSALPRLRASTRGRVSQPQVIPSPESLWEKMSPLADSLRLCFHSESGRALLALFSTSHQQLPFSKILWTFADYATHTSQVPTKQNEFCRNSIWSPRSFFPLKNIKLSLSSTLRKLVALIKLAHSRSSHVAEWSSPLPSEIAEVLWAWRMRE